MLRRVSPLLACTLALSLGAAAADRASKAQIDLRAHGWRETATNREYFRILHNTSGLAFVSDDVLLAWFVDVNEAGTLARRGEQRSRFQIHLLEFNAQTGALVDSATLPSNPTFVELFLAANGRVFVNQGTAIDTLSPELQPISHADLPASDRQDLWQASMSPGGKTLVTWHHKAGLVMSGGIEVLAREAETSRSLGAWDRPSHIEFRADDCCVIERSEDGYGPLTYLRFASELAPSKQIQPPNQHAWKAFAVHGEKIVFANDREVYVGDGSGPDVLIEKLPFERTPLPSFSVARERPLLALPVARIDMSNQRKPVQLSDVRVLLYDTDARKRAGELRLGNQPPGQNIFVALSPDGQRLAVMHGPQVNVYSVSSLLP